MGVKADLVNAVFAALKAKNASGQSLDYVKKVYMAGDVSTQLALPCLKVSLAEFPDMEEEYNGSGDFKDATLKVYVACVTEEQGVDFPFGKTGDNDKRGILILEDDVKNALDAERDSILGANGKAYDVNLKSSGYQQGAAKVWQCVILIEFKLRFPHGGR